MPSALILELLVLPLIVLLAAVAWLIRRLVAARRVIGGQAAALRSEVAARQRAASRAAWLDAGLEAGDEGVLIADAALRVVHWNRRFAALNGLPKDMPREGATLASLLRLSAEAGEFGLIDVDAEVAHQLALIGQGPGGFPRLRHRPDGGVVSFNLELIPDGGLLLRCSDVTSRHRPAIVAAVPTVVPPVMPPVQVRRVRRCVVLLVEDMRVNQVVTATQLRREGHRVDVADSGVEALRLAAVTPYDVVLMDLMMPGMSGYEAAGRLRALPGLAGRTPIFALTANTGEEERGRCLAAGMQGMMSKPVPAAVLREALRHGSVTPMPAPPVVDGLLDSARLSELRRDLPPVVLATLCRQCLDDMGDRLGALDAALLGDGTEAVEREAHALAGMASSYGLARIEGKARAIMLAARAGNMAVAREAARGIGDAFEQSRSALLVWAEPVG